MKHILAFLILLSSTVLADSTLTPDTRISSHVLGYDIQYRVYLPDGYDDMETLPVLYVTDGHSYIRQGRMPRILNRLISAERIKPVVAIFVDPRDPDDLEVNRRNQQFFCNADYLKFFSDELIPKIEQTYDVASDREHRAILGVSFGGLNSACFGLMGFDTFSGIGMHSPANHPVPELIPAYRETSPLPLKIFLSTGEPNDNTVANRKFRNVLREKGYPLKYIEVPKDHSWDNWKSLIDDVLLYFYAPMD
jgi:enterochelin esterase-like enzyme